MAATSLVARETTLHAGTDPVALSWLITVRWTTLIAGAGTIAAARGGLDAAVPMAPALAGLVLAAASNGWLTWRVRAGRTPATLRAAGLLVCADVVLLSWLLLRFGGVLNPVSVFYLVQIVLAALVLGPRWTWIVTALSVIGYAALFLTPTSALRAAQVMHPEIALHMRGMWLAFALTAVIVAALVTRLAIAVERRDRALETLRENSARATRLSGLVTLAAGAAHELSTPLATIAIAARDLEAVLDERQADRDLLRDARLIRSEIDRCRRVLDDLAGRSGEPLGQVPRASRLSETASAVEARLTPDERIRVRWRIAADARVTWPIEIVARAIGNLVQNSLQASPPDAPVDVEAALVADGQVRVTVTDRGTGMPPDRLARAGEPFYTTKPPGSGTGLGLFVARSSIEQLGGTLSLSSAEGRGTTAAITLPQDVVAAAGRPMNDDE